MFLNAASPRRSFSIPVNINLQGARRRQARELYSATSHEQDWIRGGADGRGGQRTRAQMPVSSVGEDRAVLLGFTMMSFSVLMFFVVGITTVKPHVSSNWTSASCALLRTEILEEWVDCRGVSAVPCLRVKVNHTRSNQTAFLHLDEESVLLALECFYIPKCRMNRSELQREVVKVKNALDARPENTSCYTDWEKYPGNAILSVKYTPQVVLFALLWPCLMLGGGALLVGLVKLNQYLAHLCSELRSEAAGGRLASTPRHTHGKLYRLLRRSSVQSPS